MVVETILSVVMAVTVFLEEKAHPSSVAPVCAEDM